MWIHLWLQTDRAAMLDEIVDYVKFLRLQVKVWKQLKNVYSNKTFFISLNGLIYIQNFFI